MTVLTVAQFAQFLKEFPEMSQCYPTSEIFDDRYEVDTDDYEYQQSLYN